MLTAKGAAYCSWTLCCPLEVGWSGLVGDILRRQSGQAEGGPGRVRRGGFTGNRIVSFAPNGAGGGVIDVFPRFHRGLVSCTPTGVNLSGGRNL